MPEIIQSTEQKQQTAPIPEKAFKNNLFSAKLKALFIITLVLAVLHWLINLSIRENTTQSVWASSFLPGAQNYLWGLAILFLTLWLASLFFVIVPEGYRFAVTRFGAFVRSIGPGIGIVVSPIEKAISVDMRRQTLDLPPESITTGDKNEAGEPNPIVMKLDVIAFFEPSPSYDHLKEYLFHVKNAKEMLGQIIKARLRSVAGGLTFDQIKTQGKEFSEALLNEVNGVVCKWGIILSGVELQEAPPPENVIKAMSDRRAAQDKTQQTLIEAGAAAKKVEFEANANKFKREKEAEAESNFIKKSVEAMGGPENFIAIELAKAVKDGDKIIVEDLKGSLRAITGMLKR